LAWRSGVEGVALVVAPGGVHPFDGVSFYDAENEGCEECLKIDGGCHLRRCLVCGKVVCCDDSPKTHARKHYEEDGHAVARSVEPGEEWAWCFVHDVVMPDVNVFVKH
jgi:uncharacterized UBP type Zn finger protein